MTIRNGALHIPVTSIDASQEAGSKLLLHYGTLDDDVHPNMTLLVADALIEENEDFDMLVFPDRNHGYAREPYLIRRTRDYFVRYLMGSEPPREYPLVRPR